MILIGLGSNVSGPWGKPRATIARSLETLNAGPLRLVAVSRLLSTSPLGNPHQPDFINAVARIETRLSPEALLRRLHAIEREAGRRRGVRWAPRTLDLDILDYNGLIRHGSLLGLRRALWLPHPGIAERMFVLSPLSEIAPAWRHPLLHQSAATLIKKLHPRGQGREIPAGI